MDPPREVADPSSALELNSSSQLQLPRAAITGRRRSKQWLSRSGHRRRCGSVQADRIVTEVLVGCARDIEPIGRQLEMGELLRQPEIDVEE